MPEQQAVLEYFVERLQGFPGVELAATYGSFGTDAATPTSDVDIFFVPAGPEAQRAALQVVVDGIGYDLCALDWARLERIADLAEPLIPLLLDSRVVLGSAVATQRLEELRTRCRAALADPVRRAAAAAVWLDRAAAILGRGEGVDRVLVGEGVAAVLMAAALLEGGYPASGPGKVLDQGAGWLADDLRDHLRTALLGADATARAAALRASVHRVDARRVEVTDATAAATASQRLDWLTGVYEELHSTLIKIPRALASGQICTANLAATSAVREVGEHLHLLDHGRWPADPQQARDACAAHQLPDLIACLDDPEALARAAAELDRSFEALLTERGVRIRRVGSAAELRGLG